MKRFKLETAQGSFAVCDYGGKGQDMLMVHGTGHNLLVWQPLVECLKNDFHLYAFDLRGHGQTSVDSTSYEQYWHDINFILKALRLKKPVLVGHSSGGYAVTAHAAKGRECSGIVVLDGFVLDERKVGEKDKAYSFDKQKLFEMFRYGWHANGDELESYIKEVCAAAPSDWLNQGIDIELVEQVTRNSFLNEGGVYVRRPVMEELDILSNPEREAEIYPARDIYNRVNVPMGLVLASHGLYAARKSEVKTLVENNPKRYFAKVDAGHNLHMQIPQLISVFILKYFRT